ncbi:glycerophosphoryl diester phosphodiesterase [Lihuaxuella thermophila]|uniref:Glycerophosphoryl diester phosphodiesterase n=2 Tax=Lihuaxuella thermophila TaxID=1173111 RepID=A0A1H8CH38_9BACL|nr:glycerophosphoryl diester phosphodiesterase [Lihuaxuella thermophila]
MIHPYAVNGKADMKRLLEWGVTGMFSNFPDRLQAAIREHRQETKR